MKSKPEITFAFPACMGGVASFNFNIINYSSLTNTFYSRVVLLMSEEDKRPVFLDKFNVDEVVTFPFSHKENQYCVQKRLSKLLGDYDGAIVTDSALTVMAAKQFKNKKTVFYLVHDFFYVKQIIQLGDLVDVAIAHSSFFSDAVIASDCQLFYNRSLYIPYGVRQLSKLGKKENRNLKLVFLGRLDESKGVLKLFEIDATLRERGVDTNWAIIGKGPLKDALKMQWGINQNIEFYEPDTTEEVYELLSSQDIFVFPTTFEGTPVSILECLANGVVPITNDLPGGIRDIVNQNIGFRCELNNFSEFAEHIIILHNNRILLQQMQQNCFEFAANNFNIERNADNYFKVFSQYERFKRESKANFVKMSRLDRPIFPNVIVKLIRNIK